jgi:glutamate synthase domain-containing protein 1
MCGIVGYLDKTGNRQAPVGATLLPMLAALGRRGPDSAGVAVFGGEVGKGLKLQVKLGEGEHAVRRVDAVLDAAGSAARVTDHRTVGAYLRLQTADCDDVEGLIAAIEAVTPRASGHGHAAVSDSVEVVSLGSRLEIVKQVGTPERLEATFGVSTMTGTHGIGHTRLSTESRVDLSHSQPFWARGVPDVATVHNGHITNYHKLRRQYEQRGVRFCTENDSEIIGVYLRERFERGDDLQGAMEASMVDLGGSFCYLAATADAMGFAKDPFALKPLVVAETESWAAVATEEVALRNALGNDFEAVEPPARTVHVWHLSD